MIDDESQPPRPRPKPGSLPLEKAPEKYGPQHPAQFAPPPWGLAVSAKTSSPSRPRRDLDKLKDARRTVARLSAELRGAAFDEWLRRCVVNAGRPDEWTQSTVLYENYLKRATAYGTNRTDRALIAIELASATRWGRMMGSLFDKKRRSAGWYYPLRLKAGA